MQDPQHPSLGSFHWYPKILPVAIARLGTLIHSLNSLLRRGNTDHRKGEYSSVSRKTDVLFTTELGRTLRLLTLTTKLAFKLLFSTLFSTCRYPHCRQLGYVRVYEYIGTGWKEFGDLLALMYPNQKVSIRRTRICAYASLGYY